MFMCTALISLVCLFVWWQHFNTLLSQRTYEQSGTLIYDVTIGPVPVNQIPYSSSRLQNLSGKWVYYKFYSFFFDQVGWFCFFFLIVISTILIFIYVISCVDYCIDLLTHASTSKFCFPSILNSIGKLIFPQYWFNVSPLLKNLQCYFFFLR